MPSYIYISSTGTDPGSGKRLTDPLFGPVPTLGACIPNLRRLVTKGDWVFVVSGRRSTLPQYIIGGLRVSEKIAALEAYQRFPENRMRVEPDGTVQGNIPIDAEGRQHALDNHSSAGFDRRIEAYLVGDLSVQLASEPEVQLGRERTLPFLSQVKGRPANRVFDLIGRASKLTPEDVEKTLRWFEEIKQASDGKSRE